MGKNSDSAGISKVHHKWRAILVHKEQRYNLGYFYTEQDAVSARKKKIEELGIIDGIINLDGEVWKESISLGYPYFVSNKGRVKTSNYKRSGCEHLLRFGIRVCDGRNYFMINTTNHGNHSVHRLIMESFVGPSELQVNHIDNDPQNNCLENLEYVSNRENSSHWRGSAKGCTFTNGKWMSSIKINGRSKTLGYYDTYEDAHDRYLQELNVNGIVNKYS
jgi:hypothetical protein